MNKYYNFLGVREDPDTTPDVPDNHKEGKRMNRKIIGIVAVIAILVVPAYMHCFVLDEAEPDDGETISVDGFESTARKYADRVPVQTSAEGETTIATASFQSDALDIGIDGVSVDVRYEDGPDGKTAVVRAVDGDGNAYDVPIEFGWDENCSRTIEFAVDGAKYDATKVVTEEEDCWAFAIPWLVELVAAAVSAVFVVSTLPMAAEAFGTIGSNLYDLARDFYAGQGTFISKTDVRKVTWQPVWDDLSISVSDGVVLAAKVGTKAYSVAESMDISKAKKDFRIKDGVFYLATLSKKPVNENGKVIKEEIPPRVFPIQLAKKQVERQMCFNSNWDGDIRQYINIFTMQEKDARWLIKSICNGQCDKVHYTNYPHAHHQNHDKIEKNGKICGYTYPTHLFFACYTNPLALITFF